jgi:hypothetical protein
MKLALVALMAGSAAAFAPSTKSGSSTSLMSGLSDLEALAEKSNPVLKVSEKKDFKAFVFQLFEERQ